MMMSKLCPLIFILAVGLWEMSTTSALGQRRLKRAVSNFPFAKLQGEWYDVGHTTFIWGQGTWMSQQWNFVQGRDGSMIALFNGHCKACGGCSDSLVYKVTPASEAGAQFLLHGNKGETLLLTVTSDLRSQLVVSLCFSAASGRQDVRLRCPRSRLQVSVLSRQRLMRVDRWTTIIRHLPVNMDELDTSVGESCPRLFIDPRLVTSDLIRNQAPQVISMVGFHSRRSSLVLPCDLGEHAPRLLHNAQVVWKREQADVVLTRNSTMVKRTNTVRLLRRSPPGFNLLLRGVSRKDVDIYSCYLEEHLNDDRPAVLSRVAVSSGDFSARPTIVYHSDTVSVKQGESTVLECYANGHPSLFLTWWKKSAGALEAYVRKGKGGNKLRIRNVQADDEGMYKCEAVSRGHRPVAVFIDLRVGFPPQTEIWEESILATFGVQVTLTCYIKVKSGGDNLAWRKDEKNIESGDRWSISRVQRSEYRFELRLMIGGLRREDFGKYWCVAEDQHGSSRTSVELKEKPQYGCTVDSIPVMENFNVQKYLGDMEVLHSTQNLPVNQTLQSETKGLFITLSGSLFMYYTGFSPFMQHCMEAQALSLVRLDTPGDYVFTVNGQRVRHKIVYTDYTHAVTYTCISGNDQQPCPRNKELVQIVSRRSDIADDMLHKLYAHVLKTCSPVTSLQPLVPGICAVPAKFLYKKGYIGRYPERNCQVANLRSHGNLSAGHVTGGWQLIGEIRPEHYSSQPRMSMHIATSEDRLIRLYRSVESGMCTPTEADVLYESMTNGSYYLDYMGRTVDSKILLVSPSSLVLYTCLALRHDGSCYPGSALVELYHRHADSMADSDLWWMIRAVSQACVDIKHLVRVTSSESCPVPEVVVISAKGLVNGRHTRIGCHHTLITIDQDVREDKFVGHWVVMRRNVESFSGSGAMGQFSQSYDIIQTKPGALTLMMRHYESDWGLCPPTRVLQLNQRSGFRDYLHVSHSSTVLFKLLSVSNDTAVVYWCHDVGADGVCRPQSLTVEMLKRSSDTTVSEERLRTMMQLAVDACVTVENMQETSEREECSITDTVVDLVKQGRIKGGMGSGSMVFIFILCPFLPSPFLLSPIPFPTAKR